MHLESVVRNKLQLLTLFQVNLTTCQLIWPSSKMKRWEQLSIQAWEQSSKRFIPRAGYGPSLKKPVLISGPWHANEAMLNFFRCHTIHVSFKALVSAELPPVCLGAVYRLLGSIVCACSYTDLGNTYAQKTHCAFKIRYDPIFLD